MNLFDRRYMVVFFVCLLDRYLVYCILYLDLVFAVFVGCFAYVRLGFTLFWLVVCLLSGLVRATRFWFGVSDWCGHCSFLFVWIYVCCLIMDACLPVLVGVTPDGFVLYQVCSCCFRVVCLLFVCVATGVFYRLAI